MLCYRGMLRSLWVGVLIAIPSGAGVALSLLGGNTGSLVGVAISASLLPPAVNAVSTGVSNNFPKVVSYLRPFNLIRQLLVLPFKCVFQGMLWAYAIVTAIYPPDVSSQHYDAVLPVNNHLCTIWRRNNKKNATKSISSTLMMFM